MSIFNLFMKKNTNKIVEISVDELNDSANYLSQNNLLSGKIKPVFRRTPDGMYELAMDHVKENIQELGLAPKSLKALTIEDDYLIDAQNVIKRAQAYHIKQTK